MINRSYADIGTGPKPLSLHKQGNPGVDGSHRRYPLLSTFRHATSVSASISSLANLPIPNKIGSSHLVLAYSTFPGLKQ